MYRSFLNHLPVRPFPYTFPSSALHLAAAVGAYDVVLDMLLTGANPTLVNSCSLSPGSFFLDPPHPGNSRDLVRRVLQEERKRKGNIQRLSDSSAKRAAIAAVACDASVFVHACVEFALKVSKSEVFVEAPSCRPNRCKAVNRSRTCFSKQLTDSR